jgi:hypothetical protein
MTNDKKQYGYCKKCQSLAGAAVASCQKLITQMEQVKDRLTQEFGERLAGDESVLRLALNEAEALAWETKFPQLVFATLAVEKAQAAAAWEHRQQSYRRLSPAFAAESAAPGHV